jgi:DNA-binding NarL/FixJ family response regulator
MNDINLAIIDDDQLVVALLHDFLGSAEGLNILFTAGGGEELFSRLAVAEMFPDILLLDLKMKDSDGVAITSELKQTFPSVKVIVLSSHYQPSFTGFMIKTGAAAFLPKGILPKELIRIIRLVYERDVYFLPDQVEVIRGQISSRAPRPVLESDHGLSPREIDVLRLLCQQKTAKEIGDELFITPRTVEGHKNNLFAKTGVKNMAGLVIYAIQRSIIQVDELPIL